MSFSRKCVLLSLILLVFAVASLFVPRACYAFSGGSGTAADPYLIGTPQDLDQIRNNLSAYFKLVNDIDLRGINWIPIGTSSTPFKGTLDGNGHIIRNLNINQTGNYVGLFGYIDNGMIKNLGVENAIVQGAIHVGALVGYVNKGTITEVYVKDSQVSGSKVGGLAGRSTGIINRCYVSGGRVSGEDDVGGLVGVVDSTLTDCFALTEVVAQTDGGGLVGYLTSTGNIVRCYAAGKVSGSSRIGGLVGGRFGGQVTDSYWDAEASGQAVSAGGIGKLTFSMKQSRTYEGFDFVNVWQIDQATSYPYLKNLPKSEEVVIGTTGDDSMAGGSGTDSDPYLIATPLHLEKIRLVPAASFKLVNNIDLSGFNWVPVGTKDVPLTGVFDGDGHVITNLYVSRNEDYGGLFGYIKGGIVKNLGLKGAVIRGGSYTGALVGFLDYSNRGSIANCYVLDSQVAGNNDVGGLVGYVWARAAIVDCYVSNSQVSGSEVGGLAGRSTGIINRCYVSGGQVSGGDEVGGLVGILDSTLADCFALTEVVAQTDGGGLVGYLTSTGNIVRCYAAGKVSGSSRIGGLVGGRFGGQVTDSYWDAEASGQAVSAGGTGKTTAQMKQKATFATWDFVNTWDIIEEGVSYPWLKTLPRPIEDWGTTQITSISVSPDTLSLQVNQSVQVIVTAYYSDGSAEDATSQATFVSSNPAVARVTGNIVQGASKGTATVTVTCFDKTVTIPVTVTEATVTRIDVTPNPVILVKNQSQQLTVIANYSDGSTRDITGEANYQVEDSSIASINNGSVQGLAAGSTNLTVTYQGQTKTILVTVVEPSTTVIQTGDIVVLKVPQRLQPVTYNSAAGFTVTENGVDVSVTKVEVKDGTDGWPFSEVWLYLQHPVTVGSDVVVQYNPDANCPIEPVDGGTVVIPSGSSVVNYSAVPLSLEMSVVTVQPSGDVVYIAFPTRVLVAEYQGSAGYTVYTGRFPVQVTRVATDGNGAYLYLEHPVPRGEAVTVSYTPVQGQEITTVTGAPLSGTTAPVTVVNHSTSPVVVYDPPLVSEDGRTVIISAPADLQDVIYDGNAGFRVLVGDREIPVVRVEVEDNRIILYLGVPLIGSQALTVEYTPVVEQPMETVNGTPLGGINNLPGDNQSALSLDSITVEPASVSLVEGETVRLTVTAHYSDGSAADVTTLASYRTDDSQVAAVSNEGLVTGVKAGNASITITYEGKAATIPVVVNPILTNVTVLPNPVSIAKGQSQQIVVTASYSDGSTRDVTGYATYQVGDSSVIDASNGLVRGLAEGNTILTVTYQGESVQVPVTVTAPTVESLDVEPGQVNLPKGRTQQLRVTATLSDGTSVDVTGQASYASSDAGVASASCDGRVYGAGSGSAMISVSYGGRTVQVPVEVAEPVVEALTVEPSSLALPKGSSQQLVVKATLSDGSILDVTAQASYVSGNAGICIASPGGGISGTGVGSTVVTASYSGITVEVPVTVTDPVVESLSVEPSQVNLPKGRSYQLTARATLSDGSVIDVTMQATYTSGDEGIASVSAGGLVTAVSAGNTEITASYGGKTASVPVTVTAPEVESLSVEPAHVDLPKGKTQQLEVKATLSDGSVVDVTQDAAYSSANTGIATVGAGGSVSGVNEGSTTVTVSYQGKTVDVPVVVSAPVVETLTVEPESVSLPKGKEQQLRVTATLSDGSTVDVTARAGYTVANQAVAFVSADGKVTGVGEGNTTVTVSYGGKQVAVPVTVTAPVVTGLKVEPGSIILEIGQSQQLKVTVEYSDGSTRDVTADATYNSSNNAVAVVNAGGLVTAVKDGACTVTVNYQGQNTSVPVTVKAPAVVQTGVNISPNPVVVNKYGSIRLTVVVIYSNGSTQDVTAYAQYSSADTSIATVKPNGVIYGKKDGQTEVIVTYNGKTYRIPVIVGSIPVVSPERPLQQQPVVVYPERTTSGEPVVVYPSS